VTKITLSTALSCTACGYKATLQYTGSVSVFSINISVYVSFCLIYANMCIMLLLT